MEKRMLEMIHVQKATLETREDQQMSGVSARDWDALCEDFHVDGGIWAPSALQEVEKLFGQPGMVPNPHTEQAHVQGSHCYIQNSLFPLLSPQTAPAPGRPWQPPLCPWAMPVTCPSTHGAAQTLRRAPRTEINAKVICSSSALAGELGYRGRPQLWPSSSGSMALPGFFPGFCVSAAKHQAVRTALQWFWMANMWWEGSSPASWGPALPQPMGAL